MKEIKIGDVVKKIIEPSGWVLVLDKEKRVTRDTGKWISLYEVMNSDGTRGVYTESALKKMPDVYC